MSTTNQALCATAIVVACLALPRLAHAQVDPTVVAAGGLIVTTFPVAPGAVTAYVPDDVARGERFSGTLQGPKGFALMLGDQRARTGETFQWTVPTDIVDQRLALVLVDASGRIAGRAPFQTRAKSSQEPAFRFPKLIEASRPFPVRGSFDGDSRTTKITIGRTSVRPIAESLRKVVARAPTGPLGLADCALTKSGTHYRRTSRILAVELSPRGTDTADATRELTVRGLRGIEQDVPLLVGDDYSYVRLSDIPADGTFSVRNEFRGTTASLVIPQSPREDVAVVLRTPQRNRDKSLAQQRGEDLRLLDFDALPAASELLADFTLGDDAAFAILAADERRALSLIFASMPQSGLSIQRIGFIWFLQHLESAGESAGAARAAAIRVLARILSTATAQIALHVVGVTGSEADFPLLERFYLRDSGLRDASEDALVRLGSRPHLENVLAKLAAPLLPNATYYQGLGLARVLQTAAFSGRTALVPAVCGHVSDPVVVEIDISVDLPKFAADALKAIVDGTGAAAPRRTIDDWKAYCREIVR